MHRAVLFGLLAVVVIGASCGSDDDSAEPAAQTTTSAAAPSTSVETTTTTTTSPAEETPPYVAVITALASDELGGRDDQTEDSEEARRVIIDELSQYTQTLDAAPDYLAPFANGTNVLGVIPGGELADEYVIVGAHYDHLGSDCVHLEPTDTICNGATDNGAGVGAALAIARSLASDDQPPRRSVIFAFWDREEDDFAGSLEYLADPPVPLEDTVAYVNFDIQGANLSPALRDVTIMVGAETGGPNLAAAAARATEASTLDTRAFSLLFGQGRSDHAVFVEAGIPVVFFTDANTPCYHTTGDDISVVDFAKLAQQITTAEALTRELVETNDVPVFAPGTPPATFADAESMLDVVSRETDLSRFASDTAASIAAFQTNLQAIVSEGEAAFDDTDVATLLAGSVELVSALTEGECDGFLD